MVERDAERPELRLVPARTDAEDEPAAADLVDRVGPLGQRPPGCGTPCRRRAGRSRSGSSPRRRPPACPTPPTGRAVRGPASGKGGARRTNRVVAEVLDRPGHVEEFRPAHLALDLGQLDSDLERATHRSMVAPRETPAQRRASLAWAIRRIARSTGGQSAMSSRSAAAGNARTVVGSSGTTVAVRP